MKMEKELTMVLIVLVILFIIYMLIQKTGVCSIVRNEREEFNVGGTSKGTPRISKKHKVQMGLALAGVTALQLATLRGDYYERIALEENLKWNKCNGNQTAAVPIKDYKTYIMGTGKLRDAIIGPPGVI